MNTDLLNNNLINIWQILSNKNRARIFLLIIMMFISGLAELLTIISVFPFLTAIINPDVLLDYPIIVNTLEYFNLNNSK